MKYSLHTVAIFIGFLVFQPQVSANFHLWKINEVFSNSDGTIQYLELVTASANEQLLSGHTVVSSGPDVATAEFTFNEDLAGSTAGRTVLLATQRFGLLTGVEPDYVIPDGFIATREGTLNFAEGVDVLTYETGQFPVNGAQSLNGEGQTQVPTPTRFDGTMASLTEQVLPYASVDLTNSQLEIPVLDAPGLGVFSLTMGINFDLLEFQVLDFFQYDQDILPGNLPATFDGNLNIPSLVFLSDSFQVRLSLVQDSPLVFGNAQILDVTPVPPDPMPVPETDPLEASILRGENLYPTRCAGCHGVNGSGSFQAPGLSSASGWSFEALRAFINNFMPFGNAGGCTDNGNSTCATDMANYIRNTQFANPAPPEMPIPY